MDLAIYISELLGVKGQVNVPGLGRFSQNRINGYYNGHENKFYPPRHEVAFEPNSTDDDGLVTYIANKKNISVASSKYFVDKYVANLKQRVSQQKVDIGGIGHLYYEYSTLTFKADAASKENDPAFYGFAPVKVYKTEEKPVKVAPPVVETPKPAETPKPVPTVIEPEPQVFAPDRAEVQTDYVYDEPEVRRGMSAWVIILILLIIGILALTGVYLYNPTILGLTKKTDTLTIVKKAVPPSATPKTDTSKSAQPVAKDSTATSAATSKTINATVDTFAVVRYELQAGAFRTMTKVQTVMREYERLGLHPRVLTHSIGTLHKITLGTYFSEDEAKKVADSIKNNPATKKIDISVQPYNPIK
jgi:hypothetical protein